MRQNNHSSNQSRQPTPGARLTVSQTRLARRGCAHRSAICGRIGGAAKTTNLARGTHFREGHSYRYGMVPPIFGAWGFTLIELLVVIGIVSVIAALMLPALSRAKAEAQRIQCVNNLHQMGISLRMYVDDNHAYPMALGSTTLWYDSLVPFNRLQWTNQALHCPTYRGLIRAHPLFPSGSYSYSATGTGGALGLGLGGWNPDTNGISGMLDIGPMTIRAIPESRVKAPSDMFAIADSRIITSGTLTFAGGTGTISSDTFGYPFMPFGYGGGIAPELQPFRHGKGFNFLFCDGHVSLVKRSDFINPTNSWPNWNNDHEPHEETWNWF